MLKKWKYYIIIGLAILLLSAVFIYDLIDTRKAEVISYKDFLEMVDQEELKEVYYSDSSSLKLVLKNGKEYITDNPRLDNFKEYLLLNNIGVKETSSKQAGLIGIVISGLFLLLILIYYNNKNTREVSKEMEELSRMDCASDKGNLKFSDVAGNYEAKAELMEMVDFIKNPLKYEKYGARLPRGVLLYGSPGTGKTLLAKALAGEAGVPIFPVSGSDFVEVYTGLGASRIRGLFAAARKMEKAVIFIDEIDSLGRKRKDSNGSGNEEGERTLNALLAEMSGFNGSEGIIVIAATNRIDVLDEALLGPGRFDRQLEVELPDLKAREEIINLHLRNKPISNNLNINNLAKDTIYFSGAKLESLLNEAAILAAGNGEGLINEEDIYKAYYKVLLGNEKLDRSGILESDRKITAYHEAGHALVTKLVAKDNKVRRLSIIPSTRGIGGYSLNIPVDKSYQTKDDILNNIKIALAGRAAEEIIYGVENITTGASSDLERSTELALHLVGVYGMDREFGLLNLISLQKMNMLDQEDIIIRSREILSRLYNEVIDLINRNRQKLENLAQALLEHESLAEEDINRIICS